MSFLASRTIIYWLLYYIISKLNADEYKLEKLIVLVGIIWSSIMVAQQITFPSVFFNSPNVYFDYFADTDIDTVRTMAEERAGLIRIMVLGLPYGYFLVFYSWIRLNDNFNFKILFIFLLSITALFLTGSRQIVFATMLIITLDFILRTNRLSTKRIFIPILFIILIILAYPLINNYFSSLIAVTREQNIISNEYIRMQEINFFLFNFYPHWLCYIVGNGWEHSLSSYGQEMINQIFYRSDIGIIGALNKFGLIYFVVVLMIYYKVIVPHKKIIIPYNIRLLFIFLLITSVTGVNYFETEENILLFVFIFYIIEKRSEEHLYINSNT